MKDPNSQSHLENKAEGLMLHDFKLHFKAIIFKTVQYAAEQLSPCATTAEPVLEPTRHNY